MNIFEKATRKKFKFPSAVGQLNVIDLWDLPLTSTNGANLNDVAKALNNALKSEQEESFVEVSSNSKKKELEEKLDLVKYIISVKMEERAARLEAADKAKRKAMLLELLEKKKEQSYEAKSIEELEAEINSL